MKILRLIGITLGLSLVGLVIHEVGWSAIRNTLELLGWGYLVVLAYPMSWFLLNTLGWRAAISSDHYVPLRNLIEVRLAGETFNSLLPSSYVGGEPVKAKLISRWIPVHEATSSVLVAKAAQSVALILFIGLGLVLGVPAAATTSQKIQALAALGLLASGVAIFIALLASQSFSRLGRFLMRMTSWTWLKTQEARLLALDTSLGTFYRNHKDRFLISTAWHGIGWMAGMVELMVIFALIGNPITWREAWFIGALAQLGSVIGLISPAGIGFYEGGHYMAALLLGLPPSLGVSASLIRRVREIFWDLIGLYFFSKYSKHSTH